MGILYWVLFTLLPWQAMKTGTDEMGTPGMKWVYCIGIVYAVAMASHENRSFSFQTFLHFFFENSS